MKDYAELARWLEQKGIGSYLQNSDQMVVSSENPAMPGSNCFWVTKKGSAWYLGTWLPAGYQVPDKQDVRKVCEEVFRSSRKAMYTIDAGLAARLGLRRLTEQEMEELGFA